MAVPFWGSLLLSVSLLVPSAATVCVVLVNTLAPTPDSMLFSYTITGPLLELYHTQQALACTLRKYRCWVRILISF